MSIDISKIDRYVLAEHRPDLYGFLVQAGRRSEKFFAKRREAKLKARIKELESMLA